MCVPNQNTIGAQANAFDSDFLRSGYEVCCNSVIKLTYVKYSGNQ